MILYMWQKFRGTFSRDSKFVEATSFSGQRSEAKSFSGRGETSEPDIEIWVSEADKGYQNQTKNC